MSMFGGFRLKGLVTKGALNPLHLLLKLDGHKQIYLRSVINLTLQPGDDIALIAVEGDLSDIENCAQYEALEDPMG
jgi:hypothetical protein